MPFGNQVGLNMIAHLYNNNLKCRGNLQVVYTCKQKSEGRWVEDLERGVMPGINPNPWQTDTSIGDWYYNKNWKFRPVSWVIHMLVDIVSKNGNLLLNVVQRPDGSLDPEVEQMLGADGRLERRQRRSHLRHPSLADLRRRRRQGRRAGNFKEDFAYSYKDIRFTTKGQTLYAFAMGWPDDGRLVIKSLAKSVAAGARRDQRGPPAGPRRQAGVVAEPTSGLIVTLPEKNLASTPSP